MGRYDRSRNWGEIADRVLPTGSMTFSKAPGRFPIEYPRYLVRGRGAQVWDVDENRYTDYVCSLGPIILGHNHPYVTEKTVQQLQRGWVFSLSSPLEVELGERLVELIPCAEAVRFVKSGSEAVGAAVRLARTYTGRELVAVANGSYHGSLEWFQCVEDFGKTGIPACLGGTVVRFDYNDTKSLQKAVKKADKPLAAVVIEPGRTFEPTVEFLQGVKDYCERVGAVFIMDEVVTGFRWANGGAQERYGVTPHVAAFGKALGNGAPISAIAGQADILKAFERCFISGTYGGEAVSMASALATLDVLTSEPVTEHCWRQGARLRSAFDHIMASVGVPAKAVGVDVCSRQTFQMGDEKMDKSLHNLWLQETAKRGQLFGHIQYLSYSHTDEQLNHTIEAMGFVAGILREAMLSGEPERWLGGGDDG